MSLSPQKLPLLMLAHLLAALLDNTAHVLFSLLRANCGAVVGLEICRDPVKESLILRHPHPNMSTVDERMETG